MTAPSFADALNELLAGNGMSGKELARRIGMDAAQVGRWRRGRGFPRPDNLIRVAAVLGVDYEWLLGLAYPEANTEAPRPDIIETAIRSRAAEMREAVEGTPQEFWATIIKTTFDRAIDGARDMAYLLAQREDRAPAQAINTAHEDGYNSPSNKPDAQIKAYQRGMLASVLANI